MIESYKLLAKEYTIWKVMPVVFTTQLPYHVTQRIHSAEYQLRIIV